MATKSELDEMTQRAEAEALETARFGDRLAAFTFDALLFWGGYWLSLAAASGVSPALSAKARVWLAPWAAAWVLYHAVLSSGGRQTLGKALFGLAAVDRDGGPLGFDQALTRTLGYVPSSIFNLGFLIAPFSQEGLALHDRLAGSKVVQVRELAPLGRALATCAAVASFLVLAGAWTWQNVAGPSYYRMKTVACAEHSLQGLAGLQELYKEQNGRYTADVMELAALTGHSVDYLDALTGSLQAGYGVRIALKPGGGYIILARANDARRTQVSFEGPVAVQNAPKGSKAS